ncbi:hypothetical protein U1Q18_015023 [Sarracenia purpurea var. burkii]
MPQLIQIMLDFDNEPIDGDEGGDEEKFGPSDVSKDTSETPVLDYKETYDTHVSKAMDQLLLTDSVIADNIKIGSDCLHPDVVHGGDLTDVVRKKQVGDNGKFHVVNERPQSSSHSRSEDHYRGSVIGQRLS